MTLHQLKIAIAAAKHLSITRVSQELRISQPSVSKQLRLLETEYGIRLYEKNGKGIRLTQAGSQFIENARQILLQVDSLDAAYKGIQSHPVPAPIRIGSGYLFSQSYLPSILKNFRETHPQTEISLETNRSAILEEQILNSQLDFALIITPSYLPSITYEPYGKEKLVAVISADHPSMRERAKKKRPDIRDFTTIPAIINNSATAKHMAAEIFQTLERQGVSVRTGVRCETPMDTKAAIKAGLGLGILFEKHVEAEIQNGELRIVEVPHLNKDFTSYLIYHDQRQFSPTTTALLKSLRLWPDRRHAAKTA